MGANTLIIDRVKRDGDTDRIVAVSTRHTGLRQVIGGGGLIIAFHSGNISLGQSMLREIEDNLPRLSSEIKRADPCQIPNILSTVIGNIFKSCYHFFDGDSLSTNTCMPIFLAGVEKDMQIYTIKLLNPLTKGSFGMTELKFSRADAESQDVEFTMSGLRTDFIKGYICAAENLTKEVKIPELYIDAILCRDGHCLIDVIYSSGE
jgi:hypothetical protein